MATPVDDRGIDAFLDRCVEEAKRTGHATTITGRWRPIPQISSRNPAERAFGERVAANAPIQGSAADLIKIAMIQVHRALASEGLASRMLLQVHDELIFELPASEQTVLSALVKREMESAATLDVPLLVEMGVGDDWVAAKS